MGKNKVDDKSKFLYAVIIVVLGVGLAFLFGYRKLEAKATAYETDNANLRTRIAALEQYYLTEEQNKEDTEKMTEEIKEIFSEYSGDARFEDAVYEAYHLYGASMNTIEYDTIGFTENLPIKEIPSEVVTAAGIEEYTEAINFMQMDVSYSGKVTYEGLKGMIEQIATGDYNLAIGEMSYQITDSGYIEGDTLLSFYSVDGAGCEYEEVPVVAYQTGLSNLFGVSGTVTGVADINSENN